MREANDNGAIQLFDGKKIRTAWDAQQEIWYFSIVDVISVLTDQKTTRGASTYWAVLKKQMCIRDSYYGIRRGLRIHSDGEGTRVEFIVPVRRQADV